MNSRSFPLVVLLLFIVVNPTAMLAEDPPLTPMQTTQLAEMMERDWENRPPWAEMAVMILKGESMGSGTGWFTGAERRYTWKWLANRLPEASNDGRITAEEIPELSEQDFDRVDQDRDRAITEADFAFEKNPMMEDDSPAGAIFSRLDEDSNGRLTSKEIQRWFKQSTKDTDFLSVDDLKIALGLGPQPPRRGRDSSEPRPDPRWKMMGMFLNGEMGSFSEGPALDSEAPDLDLPLVTHREEGGLELTDEMVRLENYRGSKPVVLIFGSFT
jgi:hypothetical protein